MSWDEHNSDFLIPETVNGILGWEKGIPRMWKWSNRNEYVESDKKIYSTKRYKCVRSGRFSIV